MEEKGFSNIPVPSFSLTFYNKWLFFQLLELELMTPSMPGKPSAPEPCSQSLLCSSI